MTDTSLSLNDLSEKSDTLENRLNTNKQIRLGRGKIK